MISRLAKLIDRRPKVVLIGVAVAMLAALIVGVPVFKALSSSSHDFDDPGSENIAARNELERATGVSPDIALIALVRAGVPARSAAGRAQVARVVRTLAKEPGIAAIHTAFDTHNPAFISRDGLATYVVASFKPLSGKEEQDAVTRIDNALKDDRAVTLGGPDMAAKQVNGQISKDLARAEAFGIPILILLSFIFFRGFVAAALPFATGAVAIVSTFAALRLVDLFLPLSIYAINLVTGLGLGLAIDYSLFIVSRYREELARTDVDRANALTRTLATAGRTVAFSALTVAAAMSALFAFPQRFLYSMAFGGVFVALLSATSALVFLPALLAILGPRVNALTPPALRRAAERTARVETGGFWYRLSQTVMRHALVVSVTAVAVLLALGAPFLHIRFTGVDASMLPKSASAHEVQNVIHARFNENETSPIYVVASTPSGGAGAAADVTRLANDLKPLPGVLVVEPPRPVDRTTWRIDVFAKEAALANQTKKLVTLIRDVPTPLATDVGGETANFVDQQASFRSHLPLALLIVGLTTAVLLFFMTGSVVLPLKTLILNVVSLSATLGFLVLIFQDGRFQGFLGYTSQGALNASQPILIGAIAFALSTDYAVFLLTRIKEARDGGLGETEAVAVGLERTGRIVTAAALMLAVAIGAFATSQIVLIKQLGLGVAFAVLLDATIVRALLVPSLMKMLGRRNWWAPGPLKRVYDRFGLHET